MKNLNRVYFGAVMAFAFVAFTLSPADAFSQKKTQQQTLASFPDNVSGVFKNSCVGCHSDQSKSKGKMFMNLSEWDKLSPKKQAKTGKSINKKVTKGTMPPAGFLERHPEAALSDDQKETISSWALALKKHK